MGMGDGKWVKRWGLGVPGANLPVCELVNGSPSTTAELTSLRTGGFRLCRSREPTAVGGVPCGGFNAVSPDGDGARKTIFRKAGKLFTTLTGER